MPDFSDFLLPPPSAGDDPPPANEQDDPGHDPLRPRGAELPEPDPLPPQEAANSYRFAGVVTLIPEDRASVDRRA